MQQNKIQTISATPTMERHEHAHAYAAIVLSGGYEEAGDRGRFLARPGDVILHEAFEAHLNRFSAAGATVINVPLPHDAEFQFGAGRISDLDQVIRAFERGGEVPSAIVLSGLQMTSPIVLDWPDELAAALQQNPSLPLSRWAEERGLKPWALSRGFLRVFGTSAASFRARARARCSWKAIRHTQEPLASIAVRLGFSDQAHMTRAIKRLTRATPKSWRCAANVFKTHLAR
jgi:AraC-like DNA-binding protein